MRTDNTVDAVGGRKLFPDIELVIAGFGLFLPEPSRRMNWDAAGAAANQAEKKPKQER